MSKKHREQHRQGSSAQNAQQPAVAASEELLEDSAEAVNEDAPEGATSEPDGEPPEEAPPEPTPAVETTASAPPPVVEEAVLVPVTRPTHDELLVAIKAGKSVEVRVLPPLERGKIAGLPVDRTPRVFPLSRVVDCGPSYVRALAIDERIDVRIVETPAE
jgi:hypothetical protein